MQLNQRDQQRKLFLDQQIKTLNLDISILNGISGQNRIPDTTSISKPPKFTLNQLAQLLKNKNDKSTYQKYQKNHAQQWLNNKGVNLKIINQQIHQNAKVSAQLGIFLQPKQPLIEKIGLPTIKKQTIGLAPQKSVLTDFTQDSQSQFINKQKQVSLNREILKSMKLSKRNNFRNILIQKIEQTLPKNDKTTNQTMQPNKTILSLSRDQEQTNLENRKNQYFDFVQSLVKQGLDQSLRKLKEIRPFWKIVLRHLKTIDHYSPTLNKSMKEQQIQMKLNHYVMYKSLKAIEHEFSKLLPETGHSYEKLDDIIKSMERKNRKLKVWRNSKGEPSWARAYMLLRAGRIDEVKRVLEGVDRAFLSELLIHQQSLSKDPSPSYIRHDQSKYKDTFYTQLVYFLEARQSFEPQLIDQEDLLTKTWLLLRTTCVYRGIPDMEVCYLSVGNAIAKLQSESPSDLNGTTVESYLYLGLYRNLIYVLEMILDGEIEKGMVGISYDDYFHLLTVIRTKPQLWGDTLKKEKAWIQARFINELGKYMKRLRQDGFNRETAKYMVLCPKEKLAEVATRFISTRNQYEQFDWTSFKYLLSEYYGQQGQHLYLKVSKKVLDCLQLTAFNDFLYAANLYKSIFAKSIDAFFFQQKCYVKLLLKHLFFVQKKRYLMIKQQMYPEFIQEMFDFFGISPQEAKDEQIDQELNQNVMQCENILRKSIVLDQTTNSYQEVIVQPYLFYQTFKELASLLENPLERMFELKQFDNTQMYKKLKIPLKQMEYILNLLSFFRSEFNNEITALYVFYLSMLVQRKQILSNKQCDYSGLPMYIEKVMQNLENLDSICKTRLNNIDIKKLGDEENRKKVIEANMNQLERCMEYKEFQEQMYEFLREYGGVYGLGLEGMGNRKLLNRTTGVVV